MTYQNLSKILSFIEESLLRDQKQIRRLQLTLPMPQDAASVGAGENQIRRLVEHPPEALIEVGDLVVVQCSGAPSLKLDGQRTFEIRPGRVDDLLRGRVGIESELGVVLCDCLVDDCVSFLYQAIEVTIVVVGVRKARPLQIA